MSDRERTGQRRLDYSAWHRRDSLKRFVAGGDVVASRLAMFDIDGIFVEAKHPYDRPPVALIESACIAYPLSADDPYYKSARVLTQLGRAANIPVFVVLYLLTDQPNPADTRWLDIKEFFVKECFPMASDKWAVLSPNDYAGFLLALRNGHRHVKRHRTQMHLPWSGLELLTERELWERWFVYTQVDGAYAPTHDEGGDYERR